MKRDKFISIRPTSSGITRLANNAANWGKSFWYNDGLRIAISTSEKPELSDCLILVTAGSITAGEIEELILGEMS